MGLPSLRLFSFNVFNSARSLVSLYSRVWGCGGGKNSVITQRDKKGLLIGAFGYNRLLDLVD